MLRDIRKSNDESIDVMGSRHSITEYCPSGTQASYEKVCNQAVTFLVQANVIDGVLRLQRVEAHFANLHIKQTKKQTHRFKKKKVCKEGRKQPIRSGHFFLTESLELLGVR